MFTVDIFADLINYMLLPVSVSMVLILFLTNYTDYFEDTASSQLKDKFSIAYSFFVTIIYVYPGVYSLLICFILANGYLLARGKQLNENLSAILFSIMILFGCYNCTDGAGSTIMLAMFTFLPLSVATLRVCKLIEPHFQRKLNFIAYVVLGGVLYGISTHTLDGYSIFAIIVSFVAFSGLNSWRFYKYLQPILIISVISLIHYYLNLHDIFDSRLVSLYIAILTFSIFLFCSIFESFNLNSQILKNLLPLFLLFTCINTEYFAGKTNSDHIFTLYYTLIAIVCYIVNSVYEPSVRLKYFYAFVSTVISIFCIPTIVILIPNLNFNYTHSTAIVIFGLAVLLYYFRKFAITQKFVVSINFVYLVLAQIEFIGLLWFRNSSGFNLELVYLLAAISVLYLTQSWFFPRGKVFYKFILPFLIVINSYITLFLNVGYNVDLFLKLLILVVIFSSKIIKLSPNFRLPTNLVLFSTLVYFNNDINYALVLITITFYIKQLYDLYETNEVNNYNKLYIILLSSLTCLIPQNIIFAQIMLIILAFGCVKLDSMPMFTNIKSIVIAKSLVYFLLNILLILHAIFGGNNGFSLLSLVSSFFSILAIYNLNIRKA